MTSWPLSCPPPPTMMSTSVRELVAHVVFEQLRRVAVPRQALLQNQGIAPVAVDVHVPRVQLQDPDGAL